MVRGPTVRGPTRSVDAMPSAPRTVAGGVFATLVAVLGLAAFAYPVVGLVVGAAALVTVVALRRRRSRPTRSADSDAPTARERAGQGDGESPVNDGATDATASARCEAAD